MRGTSDKDRHDREGGRQLLVLTLPVAVACGLGGYFGESLAGWIIAALATLASGIVLAFPAASIRLVSGRFAELLPAPGPPAADAAEDAAGSHEAVDADDEDDEDEADDADEAPPAPVDDAVDLVRTVFKAGAEGTPVEVALTERWLGKRQRRGLGIAMMIGGAALVVAGFSFLSVLPDLRAGGAGLSFVGLVLWYRTL